MEAFGQNARDRRAVGLAGVAALHVLVVYALVTGLGKDLVKVIQQKVEVAVISEPPPPPPPPPKIEKVVKDTAPPPPQQQPAYVPPPIVAPTTQTTANTIQATSEAKAPSAPAVPQATAAPAPVGPISTAGNCSKFGGLEYPRKALGEDISGVVTLVYKTNAEGKLSEIISSKFSSGIPMSFRSQFLQAAKQSLQGNHCKADTTFEQELSFKLESE